MAAAPIATERYHGVNNIHSYVPVILDLKESKYDVCHEFFTTHCLSFNILGHIDGSLIAANTAAVAWKKRDGVLKLWLYGSLSPKLFQASLKIGSTSRKIFLHIEKQFHNNKDARAIRVNNELCTKDISDMKIADYYREMKTLADSHANVDALVQDRTLVIYVLKDLISKFDNIINVIKH